MTDKPQDMLKESLSALLDDESQDLETRRVLNELDKDAELKSSWQNYQMIGDLMRNQVSSKMDLTAAINQSIDNVEVPVMQDQPAPKKSNWIKAFTSVAVAASVTLAVLLGVQVEQQPSNNSVLALENSPQMKAPSLVAPSQLAASTSVEAAQPQSEQELQQAQQKLQQYLLEHTENSAENTGRGVLPYARVVNFEEQPAK